MWGLEDNQAAQLGLLSAGAAMLDPRGTGGNAGASINKSVRAGLNTYIPMMQWQERRADRKTDRDWNKNQDIIRNVLAERQFKLRKNTADAEMDNREANTNIRRTQLRMQQEKYSRDKKMYDLRMEYMGSIMGGGQVAPPDQTTNFGPRTGATPPDQMGPRVQPQGQFSAPGAPPVDTSALTGPTDVNAVMQGGQPPQAQSRGMSPYDQMNVGQFMGMPGMEAQGKDRAEMAQFIEKEVIKYGMDMSKIDIRMGPMGLDYFAIEKKTGKPLFSVDSQMNIKPAPGAAQQGGTIDAADWLKQNR